MLKTSGSIEFLARPREGVVGLSGDSRPGRDGSKLDRSEIDDGEFSGGEVGDEVGKKGQKTSKFKKSSKSKKIIRSSDFLTLRAKLVFTKLR